MKSKKFSIEDIFFMKRALALASKGSGKTSPNPMVGAVVVKNGKIIGEGYHHKAGKEHAEVLALKNLKPTDLQGATLYVNLEPCVWHVHKKTPACADLVSKSGIKSVIIATLDPNPAVHGKGFRFLKNAGIQVHIGLLKKEAAKLNEIFFKTTNSSLPFVVLKMASSLDGKIATANGDSQWITNEPFRHHVHRLRSTYDAILTSSKTVLQDNPHLGVRMVSGRDPFRIIIDRKLITSAQALVYRDKNVMVITTEQAPVSKIQTFQKKGIRLKIFKRNVTLRTILSYLKKNEGIMSVMIEAGGTLAAAFIKEKLVDKIIFGIAPMIIGEEGKSVMGPLKIKKINAAIHLKNVHFQLFGDNVMIEGYF